jgi:hypothetical protein
MLKKAHISPIKPFLPDNSRNEKWIEARLAKFTSSEIHDLTNPTGFTVGSLNYIRRKVGEELTGEPAKEEFSTTATMHGNLYEAEAIHKFAKKAGLEWLIVQQLITDPDTRFGSTPDGLIILRESPDKTEYEVETVEVKCPITYDAYIALFECEIPEDVKKVERKYYWQVLDQMHNCGAKRGHFVVYHPKFKAGNHKSIAFNALDPTLDKDGQPVLDKAGNKIFPIKDDLKLLRIRKKEALEKFDQIRSKLMAVPAI